METNIPLLVVEKLSVVVSEVEWGVWGRTTRRAPRE